MVWTAVTGGYIVHLDVAPWYALPLPGRWWHHCRVATVAMLGVLYPEELQRCACGGWRRRHFGSREFTPWQERHSRRAGRAHSLTVH